MVTVQTLHRHVCTAYVTLAILIIAQALIGHVLPGEGHQAKVLRRHGRGRSSQGAWRRRRLCHGHLVINPSECASPGHHCKLGGLHRTPEHPPVTERQLAHSRLTTSRCFCTQPSGYLQSIVQKLGMKPWAMKGGQGRM